MCRRRCRGLCRDGALRARTRRAGRSAARSVLTTSARCRPDRRVDNTRPVAKTYSDPVGDAYRGRDDITRVRISDLRGVVTFSIDVKNPRPPYIEITFDTNCDGNDNYDLNISRGAPDLERLDTNSDMFQMRAPTIVRTASPRDPGTITYTFRFSSQQFGGTTAFRFHAWTELGAHTVSDFAPDGDGAYWYYDLLSR